MRITAAVGSQMQRFFRAGIHTAQTEDALRGVALSPGVARNLHVHRAGGDALPAMHALILVHPYAHKRARSPHFQKHRYRADVFVESPIVPEGEGQSDAHRIVGNGAADECIEHDAVDIGNLKQQQRPYEQERRGEQGVSDPSEAFALVRLGHLARKAFEHHGHPTSVPAPTSSEQERAEDLRHEVVDDGPLEDSQEQVVSKSRNLHVLAHDEAHEDEHVEAHGEQDELPRPPDFLDEQQRAQG